MRSTQRRGGSAARRRTRATTPPRRKAKGTVPVTPELRRALAALESWSHAPVRTDPVLLEALPALPAITRRLLDRLEHAHRIEQATQLPWFAIPLA